MGIIPWQEDFFSTIQQVVQGAEILQIEPYHFIKCSDKLYVHLIPLKNHFLPLEIINLQVSLQRQNIQLIQLWEDIWIAKRTQVLSRMHSFLRKNKGLHGRKADLVSINKKDATSFLNNYHLQGYVNASYQYGLVINEELIAVASFSKARLMKLRGANYQSAELVRFASKDGFTVVGGLSKLIKHFTKQVTINDLMTYADRDWSLGMGYAQLGFALTETTPSNFLYVNSENLTRYFPHRLPKEVQFDFENQKMLNFDDYLAQKGFHKVFNTGNLKYHLYL